MKPALVNKSGHPPLSTEEIYTHCFSEYYLDNVSFFSSTLII